MLSVGNIPFNKWKKKRKKGSFQNSNKSKTALCGFGKTLLMLKLVYTKYTNQTCHFENSLSEKLDFIKKV